MSLSILVVDDAQISRNGIARYLTELGHRVEAHANPFTALDALEGGYWDLVLTDLRMPSMDGIQFLKEIKARSPDTAVIIMTAYGTVETAVQAIREGALDYVLKPFHTEQLRLRVERLHELLRSRQELASLRGALGTATYAGMVGSSPEMERVLELIGQFADQPANVLITGETGTGKEMVARALHDRSGRKEGPFIAVPCGAVPRELAESELFGHEAGAFTGAVGRRHGRVELAHGGTLFLDDVDDLPLDIQPKLLRVMEEREFQRVGGERLLKSDLRFISSTKKNLEALVREGRFRQDLLYRLQVLTIDLPPLRARKTDIPALADHFLALCAKEAGQRAKALSKEGREKLMRHAWPGNVRELRHAIEYAVAVSNGSVIQAEDFQLLPSTGAGPRKVLVLNTEGQEALDLRGLEAELEKEAILWALRKAEGDQGRAAELLKMPRTTLSYRLQRSASSEAATQAQDSASPKAP